MPLKKNLNDANLTNEQAPLLKSKRNGAYTGTDGMLFSNTIARFCKEIHAVEE